MIEGSDVNVLLAQAQQMWEQMLAACDNLVVRELEAATGGGLVRVKLSGLGELLDVTITSTACGLEDTESLSALIVTAFRSVRQQVESATVSAAPQIPGIGF